MKSRKETPLDALRPNSVTLLNDRMYIVLPGGEILSFVRYTDTKLSSESALIVTFFAGDEATVRSTQRANAAIRNRLQSTNQLSESAAIWDTERRPTVKRQIESVLALQPIHFVATGRNALQYAGDVREILMSKGIKLLQQTEIISAAAVARDLRGIDPSPRSRAAKRPAKRATKVADPNVEVVKSAKTGQDLYIRKAAKRARKTSK